MGPARFLCATLLKIRPILVAFAYSGVVKRFDNIRLDVDVIMSVHRGISSSGRALALHARGAGIDTRILHYMLIGFMLSLAHV